jgi:hypothetical protein
MNYGKTVLAQLLDFIPYRQLQACVDRYDGHKWIQSFSCRDQLISMVFAQLTGRRSLRDIEACLLAQKSKLYHCGLQGTVARSTLSDANNHRDWRIYHDLAQHLIAMARPLYIGEPLGLDLDNSLYALDSTTIDLCLSLFPWATFVPTKAGVKLHTLLDLQGSIPTFIQITAANVHDVNILDHICLEPGATVVMDRGYLDFARLFRLTRQAVFFVIRAKCNLRYRRVYSRPVEALSDVVCDQTISLIGLESLKSYPLHLRRIRYRAPDTRKQLVFLTNNWALPAQTIADIYRCRWKIELFFKWIKQHLRIKSFFGCSENAVRTQIWIAVTSYLLVAIAKKRLRIPVSLYTMLQVISVCAFEKVPLFQLFTEDNYTLISEANPNQLSLLN